MATRVGIKAVQAPLRHPSTRITQDYYLASKDEQQQVAEQDDAAMQAACEHTGEHTVTG